MSFLEQTAEELLAKYHNHLQDVCVLFPNRRAGLLFQEALARKAGVAIWAPRVDTLSSWLESLHPYRRADMLTLVGWLWTFKNQNRQHTGDSPLSMEDYAPEALKLLTDFQDLDLALADPQAAFAYQGYFVADPEDPAVESQADLKAHAQSYQTYLHEAHAAYEYLHAQGSAAKSLPTGHIVRQQAEQPAQYLPPADMPDVWLVGFDGLAPAEIAFLHHIHKAGKLHTRWDVDAWYLQDRKRQGLPNRSAGSTFLHMRTQHPWLGIPTATDAPSLLSSQESEIHTYPAAGTLAQIPALAIELGALLSRLHETHGTDAHALEQALRRVAVVLPNEELLEPLLNHLPPSLSRCNITMGYSMQLTQLYKLLAAWMHAQKHYTPDLGYHHSHVRAILLHPLVKQHLGQQGYALDTALTEENRVYWQLPAANDAHHPLLIALFTPVADGPQAAASFNRMYEALAQLATKADTQTISNPFHREVLNALRSRLNLLADFGESLPTTLSGRDQLGMLRRLLEAHRLPFAGEPLGGVQIMGMLETRGLQFDHVFIVSVNEGVLPPKLVRSGSFLPLARQKLGLSQPEELQAQYSYLFWRLMQGAQSIHLFYDEEGTAREQEPSRFLEQLRLDWLLARKQAGQALPMQRHRYHQQAQVGQQQHIEQSATAQKVNMAEQLSWGTPKRVRLSPSALSAYLSCSLKFWLRRVEKLKPLDEVSEEPDAGMFGRMVHAALEQLYTPLKNQDLRAEDLRAFLANDAAACTAAVDAAANQEFKELGSADQGAVHLQKAIARNIVSGVVRADLSTLEKVRKLGKSFTFAELETTSRVELAVLLPDAPTALSVYIEGTVDRVDAQAGKETIWDYKTGGVNASKDLKLSAILTDTLRELAGEAANTPVGRPFELSATAIEVLATMPEKAFQVLCYAWLRWQLTGNVPIHAGIIALRNSPPQYPIIQEDKEDLVLTADILEGFTVLLQWLVSQILNPDTLFVQTTNANNCTYCDYTDICGRKVKRFS